MTVTEKSTEQLRREWVIHPHFKYRGCAPDADDPMRMAGDPSLHVGAHNGPDAFLPEGQVERRLREDAAIEVCLNCPVMVQCDAYASSVRPDGRLAEPEGVWGGRRALERHKALIRARHAVPAASDRRFRTAQKQAVLRALASCWDPFEVADAAGVDVRTANWQRSSLVRLLGLPKDVSRMRALAVARERGLLDGVEVVPDDGSVPAIPPPTRLPAGPQQLHMWGVEEFPTVVEVQPRAGRGVRSPSMKVKFRCVDGQEDLVLVEATGVADVCEMFPAEIALEAAA
ncbi:WhiB family transcriptional regulator [Streptomyces sp. NPDC029006]|uniref:WhiB family transcriptional regulator n=1 Tax=Streptomyces sp. NPDC029006 TaxID=3155467 RepID=UPI0033D822F0